MSDSLLLDDFSRADGVSAIGTRWEGLSDRVMGGLSDMRMEFVERAEERVLHMRGTVRLENRGGFIQARLPLDPKGGTLDAGAWRGLGLRLRGKPGPYYLHLRTRQNWMPWQYFRAPLEVAETWEDRFVGFELFEGKATRSKPDLGALKSIAVVAYGEAFEAEIELARIALLNP